MQFNSSNNAQRINSLALHLVGVHELHWIMRLGKYHGGAYELVFILTWYPVFKFVKDDYGIKFILNFCTLFKLLFFYLNLFKKFVKNS